MTVEELAEELLDAMAQGYADRDVVIPCQTGGSMSVTEVEAEEDDFLVRLT
jgi:hypothetical protein